jgi:M6 family metalloprotease-like protein
MNKVKTTLIVCLLTMISISVFAMPAYEKLMSKRQSNGKEISYFLQGDEFLSWAKTTDNYTLLYNRSGDLVYAVLDKDKNLVVSNVVASNVNERTNEEKEFLLTIRPNLFYSKTQVKDSQKRRIKRDSLHKNMRKDATIGRKKYLVLLVNFSNLAMDTNNAARFHHQIGDSAYTSNGATGSVRDYYYDNSMGRFTSEFDVYGPYTLPHTQAYYGARTSTSNDTLPAQMVYDAAVAADSDVDFSQYDNDGDGYVDMVYVIYAGRGEHNGGGDSAIWAHSWVFPSNSVFDNTHCYSYSCSCELNYDLTCDAIGAMCHEMGHVLGLPDFYDTDYGESGGTAIHPYKWDVMASGSYNNNSKTPPYLSMTERKILAWGMDSTLTLDTTVTLYPLSDSNFAYSISLSDSEYVMLENRTHKKWDAYTPAKGMIVFHGNTNRIDNWQSEGNAINVNPNNRGYYIEPATGDSTNILSDSTTYPGSRNVTSKTDFHLTSGFPISKSLINIHYLSDSSISLHYVNNAAIFSSTLGLVTDSSALINGTITGNNITNTKLEYRKATESSYTSVNITPTFSYTINNLAANTVYKYRLSATINSVVSYSNEFTFRTSCQSVSLPYNEDLEASYTEMPPCWYVSGGSVAIVPNGNNPVCQPHTGYYMLEYGSYWLNAGNYSTVSLPMFSFPNDNYKVSFWIYRLHNYYSSANEGVGVYMNTTDTLLGATSLGFISNDRTSQPTTNADGWYNYSVNVPQGTNGNRFIILKLISQYSNNTYLDDFSVRANSSIQTIDNSFNISLYPNPSKETSTLNIDNINDKTRISVVDMQGRVILQRELIPNNNSITTTIDTKDLSQGVYFVKVNSDKINVAKKLIVTKD